MTKVILKNEKSSEIFSLVFPADLPMNYSEEKKAIEHPINKGVWIQVQEAEIKEIFESVA